MTNVPVIEGFGCRLRPVELSDAAYIVNLRNQPFAKGNIHATSTSVADQEAWIARWKQREHDYYWIIETGGGDPIGTIGLYDICEELAEGMPGRWVMESHGKIHLVAPFLLVYGFAFEQLHLKRLVMDIVASNKKVCRFHAMYGAAQIAVPERYAGTEAEVGCPLVWMGLTRDQWLEMNAQWSVTVAEWI